MSEEKIELIEDVLGDFGFRVRWQYLPHWADVEVFEIVGRDDSGKMYFERKGAMQSMDQVETIDEAQPYLEGFIKWDGCAELNQGNPHWCGVRSFKKHADLLQYIWNKSGELLKSRALMDSPQWTSSGSLT